MREFNSPIHPWRYQAGWDARTGDGKMADENYRIQELLQREVYVGENLVGTIVGERYHPNEERVQSMRLQVTPGVAEEFMRKPAEHAPLSKELIHSIQDDGSVKLSKSMRELQRRWRNTVRIEEQLYAPDELLDRAVLDDDGRELGVVTSLVKVKRTYRGITVQLRSAIRRRFGLGETIDIPVTALARTRARLDEIVLSRTFEKLRTLPSYIQINEGVFED
ncbi:MAG: hypothetical protein VYC11_01150 [Candidatus Thermoplasmatota archaeon]|nr:hypothetical protein [Candidatus Thermoplasmatota archaeon]MEC9089955.1 hypothetical protein [Candidatus Thermoplasmatota archaeon]MED5486678.1 hypothetical protein [Candidatus Thermoplasmatota archaeon]